MTSSHQEALFNMPTDDTTSDQPSTVSHIDVARKAPKPGEVSDEQFEHKAEALGSYFLARAYYGMLPEDDESDHARERQHLPGSPLSFPKRGNVRDFHDGGRSDEHRGGFGAPELGSEADMIMREHLADLQQLRDLTVEDDIRNGFEEDVIKSEYTKVDAARSQAIARYRAHIQRHYPTMDSDMVSDLLADFAETLLPPSPLQ